jgi:E3 ubiquitin-protein ligase synoviolin
MVFFIILLIFHGLPIHILRDVFYTMRSFAKRIHDFTKYRDATRDMNARYPDATAEDLERENTCIICREEMRPWQANEGQQATQRYQDERYRPKKLPCGHTLHFSCLRSWLERQQVCPICRRSVLVSEPSQDRQAGQAPANQQQPQPDGNANRPGQPPAAPGQGQGQDQGQGQGQGPAGPQQPQANDPNRPNLRVYNFGPFRLAFGAGPENQLNNMIQRFQNPALQRDNPVPPPNAPPAAGQGNTDPTPTATSGSWPQSRNQYANSTLTQLHNIEQRLRAEQEQLRSIEERFLRVQRMNLDVSRRRAALEAGITTTATGPLGQGFAALPGNQRMGPGDPNLPPGVVLPEGWSLIPLRRMPEANLAVPGGLNVGGIPGQPMMASAPLSRRVSHEQLSGGAFYGNPGGPTLHPSSLHPPSAMAGASVQLTPPTERQGRSPSPAPARPATLQSQAAPAAAQQPGTQPSASASTGTLPGWSFVNAPTGAGSSAQGTTDGESSDGKAEDRDKGKGKAKAATVEDVEEDEDEDEDEDEEENDESDEDDSE